MKKTYKKSIFIFRRDLRIEDNTALIKALELSEMVVSIFIFDQQQVAPENPYRSLNCIQFMLASLQEVHQNLVKKNARLHLLYGRSHEVVESLIKKESIDAVFVNQDYTPFSRERDAALSGLCQKADVSFLSFHDALLHEPNAIFTQSKTPYTIFTPYYKAASKLPVEQPQLTQYKNYYADKLDTPFYASADLLNKKDWARYDNPVLFRKGGRKEALAILAKIPGLVDYKKTRDFPTLPTNGLSAHNKFGTVSIREVYHSIGSSNPTSELLRELYWRDFFTQIAYHFPRVFGHAFHTKYDSIHWSDDSDHFEKWCNALTGFPIVDAGMRELNTTGFMHNRVRMIVASFLVKDLHLDWRWGERYFAQKLVDYDPAVNNGNWQWAASTGCDSQPYFRIFNPWLQQKKFDPECTYIKRWIPELQNIPAKHIHAWASYGKHERYPVPMLDHSIEARKAKKMYQSVL